MLIMLVICICVHTCVKEFTKRVEIVAEIHESIQSRQLVQGASHLASKVPQ